MFRFVVNLFFISCIGFILNGQELQSPSEFLGYTLGTEFSRHHQVVDYFKYVSTQNPKQLKLQKYGETYERRPLYVAFISSEDNIKNLENIRLNHLKNAGIIEGVESQNKIVIVWLSYNVHGNEASSTEASMKTLYNLLTKKQDWLKNTVVIIDPCMNPDGRDRYANWYNKTASKPYDIDQQATEHNEPWPSGRPNHYLFDLNRDWAWATQIESQYRLKIYNQWLPHIHVDFHEQGINEPYYFAPAAEPYHEIITDWQRHFQTQIGKNHAHYFDKNGWLFFTRERFDLLYPSYGDTYPTFMGAIGMTYEQAGHGRGGLGVLNDEGEVLTLVDRIEHHTITGLSTIEMASKHAESLNSEFKKFFNNSNLKYKSYLLQGNTDHIEQITSLLDKHKIKYGFASNGKANGYKYSTQTQGSINTTTNDLVISTNQPKGKMVKVLFEPQAKLSDSLTYDITVWSLPYAYGLDAIASTNAIKANTAVKDLKIPSLKESYGYVSDWNAIKDARFLTALLQQNFKVRFTEKPLNQNNKTYKRGSLIVTQRDNKNINHFYSVVDSICKAHHKILSPISTGFSDHIPDIGSPDIKLINKHNIAILSGKHTSSLSYGALWHFFEQQLQYPVTSINTEDLNHTKLSKYHVLIIPSGNYKRLFDENQTKGLISWIKKGGKVIAIDKALNLFANKEEFALKRIEYNDTDKKDENKKSNLIAYADREREHAKNLITGAIFKTKVDYTHPMAFGYGNSYYTLKLGSSNYKLLDKGYNIVHIDRAEKVSGFAGSNVLKKLDSTLIFGEERLGQGSIIYMVDNPLFRGFWENGKLFLVNAIFFVNNNAFEL